MPLEQMYWHGRSMVGLAVARLPDQLNRTPAKPGTERQANRGGQVAQVPASQAGQSPSGQAAQRLAKAQRVLALAEQATGSRPVGATATMAVASQGSPPRLRLASSRGGETNQCTLLELRSTARALLGPGRVVQVSGSTGALFAVAAGVWGPEDWGVLAGLPDAGYLAAAQAGVVLERCVVVPDLGGEPLRTLAGLIDAFGVVVLGPSLPAVAPADRRRLEARLRHRQGCLVSAAPWGGAQLNLKVDQVVHQPLGQGDGLLSPGLWQARWSGPLARSEGVPDQPAVLTSRVSGAPARAGTTEPVTSTRDGAGRPPRSRALRLTGTGQ